MNQRILLGMATAVVAISAFGLSVQKLSEKDKEAQQKGIYNMKQLTLGMMLYCTDNDDQSPHYTKLKDWKTAIEPYVRTREVFRTTNPAGGELKINLSTCGVSVNLIPKPEKTPVFYESKTWADTTRIVGYWDGHVGVPDGKAWKVIEKRLHLSRKAFR